MKKTEPKKAALKKHAPKKAKAAAQARGTAALRMSRDTAAADSALNARAQSAEKVLDSAMPGTDSSAATAGVTSDAAASGAASGKPGFLTGLFGRFSKKSPKDQSAHAKAMRGDGNADPLMQGLYHKQAKKQSRFRSTLTKTEKKHFLENYLERSGAPWTRESIERKIYIICGVLAALASIYWIVQAALGLLSLGGLFLFLLITWTLGAGLLWVVLWGGLYLYLDFRMYRRKREIEEILPDFLQLVSSNVSAGMPIDRALWFAIRPKFGVLAKEMETVAKSTMTGEDLKVALREFSAKYDSVQLRRSVNLIIEGLEAGGEMADLLNKIALNFEEIKVMKKDMSSSVTTYVIFISFATIFAAPALFALATELLIIIQNLTGSLDLHQSSSFLTLTPNAIKISDFRIFAFTMLCVSSLISSMLISTISRGNIRDGLKYIPLFVGATLGIYFLASYVLHSAFSGIFSAI